MKYFKANRVIPRYLFEAVGFLDADFGLGCHFWVVNRPTHLRLEPFL